MATPSEPIIYRRPLTLSNSVELYWYPPLNNGGNVITSYIIECSNISYINILPSTDKKSIIQNLITGNSYVFTIKATNINGNGNIAEFNFVIPGFKPDVPTNLNYNNAISNYSRINFSFNNPQYTGNSDITYNVIRMTPVDVFGNILLNSPFIHDHSSVASNIINPLYDYEYNKNYNYQSYIKSVNTVNDSDRNYFSTIINPNLPNSGLKLWLDPYDLSTITLSNNKVTKWEDKSINKANATISESFAPTYDSSNSLINFNGLQYLNLPANTLPSANSSYSIFTYVSTANISRSNQWFLYSGTPTANQSFGSYINANSIVHSWWNNNNHSKSNIINDISYLLEMTYDSGIRRTFLNGTLVGYDNISNKNSGTGNNLIGTNSNFTGNLIGSVGDIIIYNRILNDYERLSVNNYLTRRKYNLSLQNIGNVITWLDATDPNNFYDVNNEFKINYNNYIYNWLDRSYSNNNASQSNISNLPIRRIAIQNNLDTLEFNQSYLTLPTARYPLDAFIILKLANITDRNGVLGIGPSSNNYSSLSYVSGNKWSIDATSNSVIASTTETSNNFLLIEWSIADNNNYIRRFSSNIANVTTGTWTLPNNSNIFIGNANGFDFSKKFKGHIGEIIMFNKQLDDNTRYPIEGYLAWKWGLQTQLPSIHPFRNFSPYLFYGNLGTFVPSSLSQLVLWLDASNSSSIIRNGNTINRWTDLSGTLTTSVNNLSWSDNQLNGLPTINISNGTVTGNFPGSIYRTIQTTFIVANQTASIIDGNALLIYIQPGNVDSHRVLDYGFNHFRTLTFTDSWKVIDFGSSFFNNYFITTTYLSSTTLGGSINGNTPQETGALQFLSATSFSLGSPWKGQVAEVLTYSRILTTYERQKVEGYLAWKWGLQSNLPSSHYYKNIPPSVISTFSPAIYSPWSWFDASNTSSITVSGSNVTSIQNKGSSATSLTPNTVGLVTYNSSYTMNGKNLITVSKNGGIQLSNTNYTWNGSCIMVVIKHIQGSSSGQINWFLYGGLYVPQVGISGFNLEWGTNSIGYSAVAENTPGVSANSNVLLCFNVGGSTNAFNALGINGTNYALNPNSTTSGNTTLTWDLCAIAGGSLVNGPAVSVAEHIIFNRGLETNERQEMEGYLAWKWGLQSSLPSNHPYKNWAP